jgi:hypothetical protein
MRFSRKRKQHPCVFSHSILVANYYSNTQAPVHCTFLVNTVRSQHYFEVKHATQIFASLLSVNTNRYRDCSSIAITIPPILPQISCSLSNVLTCTSSFTTSNFLSLLSSLFSLHFLASYSLCWTLGVGFSSERMEWLGGCCFGEMDERRVVTALTACCYVVDRGFTACPLSR